MNFDTPFLLPFYLSCWTNVKHLAINSATVPTRSFATLRMTKLHFDAPFLYIKKGNNIAVVQSLKIGIVVILRNEGSRAGTLPVHSARCFTLFSMTCEAFWTTPILSPKKKHNISIIIRIFEINFQDTCTRGEKYSSKLDTFSLVYSYLCHIIRIKYTHTTNTTTPWEYSTNY